VRGLWFRREVLLRAAGLAVIIGLSLAPPVSAKVPYFTVEITPAAPAVDEPILIVVHTWEDPQHTIAAPFDADALDGLLVIRARGGGNADIPVPLRKREPGRFEASVTLPAGDWVVVAFPDRTSWAESGLPAGFPDNIRLSVQGPRADPQIFLMLLITVAVAVGAAALQLGPRLSRRRPDRRRPSPG